MELQANQGPAAANFATAMRNATRWILMILVVIFLAGYLFPDILELLRLLAHKLGETVEMFNYILQVIGRTLDGIRTSVGLLLSHAADVWCMLISGPTCNARGQPKGPQTARDLRKAPLANTQEMMEALQQLSAFLIHIDLPRRVRSLTMRASNSRWSDHIHEELNVEGKEAVDNWNTVVSSKNLAVSSTRAMTQELRHQYTALDRELRRSIPWTEKVLSPSTWGREDLRPDILTMAKGVARNVDESRELLFECFSSSKGMKERALKLQELAESQQAHLAPIRDSFEIIGWFSSNKQPDWYTVDSLMKEWNAFGVLLDSVYATAVEADKLCSDLDTAMRIWMRNFNNTRGLSYDIASDTFIGPSRHPREILSALDDTIPLLN